MPLSLITAPTLIPVSLVEAKLHLRVGVDASSEDTLITALINAATEDAEHLMQRAILPQQWQLTLDGFYDQSAPADVCNSIALQRPTVTAVTSVKYRDSTTGTLTTLADTEYQVDLASPLVGRLAPAYGKSWPAVRAQLGAVQVLFTCGWADAASVPAAIKAWVLLRVGALYQNREAWTLGKAIERNPFLDHLLDRHRIFTV